MSLDNGSFKISNIKFKRGTKAQLESSNYVPSVGEIVVATDAPTLKIGDGTTLLSELPFLGGVEVVDSYDSESRTAGLSAAKGNELDSRIRDLSNIVNTNNYRINSITTIDCGELPVEETEQQSGE